MAIKTDQELAQAVNQAIKESGVKKTFIAEKLGYLLWGVYGCCEAAKCCTCNAI